MNKEMLDLINKIRTDIIDKITNNAFIKDGSEDMTESLHDTINDYFDNLENNLKLQDIK